MKSIGKRLRSVRKHVLSALDCIQEEGLKKVTEEDDCFEVQAELSGLLKVLKVKVENRIGE